MQAIFHCVHFIAEVARRQNNVRSAAMVIEMEIFGLFDNEYGGFVGIKFYKQKRIILRLNKHTKCQS